MTAATRLWPALLALALLAAVPARAGEAEGDAALRDQMTERQAPAQYRGAIAAEEAEPAKTAARKERKRRKLAVLHSKLACAVQRADEIDGRMNLSEPAREFREAIALDPVLAFPYYGLARALCDQRAAASQCGEALRQIGRALARDPGEAVFWQEKADIEVLSGKDYAGGVADCRKAVGLAASWDAGVQSCGSYFYHAGLDAEGRAVDARANANSKIRYRSLGDRDLRYLDAVLSRRAKREREESQE